MTKTGDIVRRCPKCGGVLRARNPGPYCSPCQGVSGEVRQDPTDPLADFATVYGYSAEELRRFKEAARRGDFLNITFVDGEYVTYSAPGDGIVRGYLPGEPHAFHVPPGTTRVPLVVTSSAVSSLPFVTELRLAPNRQRPVPVIVAGAVLSGTFAELHYSRG